MGHSYSYFPQFTQTRHKLTNLRKFPNSAPFTLGYRYATHLTNKNEAVHINRHGMQEMQLTKSQYRSRAVAFANKVDIVNHVSFVRENGLTYKYSLTTGEYAIITKEGIVTTYFRIDNKRWEEVKKQYDK